VLLVKRGREPLKGFWSLPGGVVEAGELLEEALHREVREETGLEAEVVSLVEVFERIMRDGKGRPEYHYVLHDYYCKAVGGELRAGDDAAQAEWVRRSELGSYRLTEATPAVIDKAFRMRAGRRAR